MAAKEHVAKAAKLFVGATAAVAVAGETVAIINKLRDEGHRPLFEYATSGVGARPGDDIDAGREESFSSRAVATVLAPLHEPGNPVDHSNDDEFPLAAREGFIGNDVACEMLETARTPVRPRLRPLGYRMLKRGFDLVFSSAVIVAGAVPAAAICAAIAIDSPGAPVFRQRRIARVRPDGTIRTFWMLKFRTMTNDAEEKLEGLYAKNDADGPMFKIKDDPRVTRMGKLLRPHSLDELPQFVNVLVGDMSVVGPRPALPNEVVTYDRHELERLVVPQGLTGYWQVRGRSDVSWDDNVQYDLEYVEEASVKADLTCVFHTVVQMFTGRGAY